VVAGSVRWAHADDGPMPLAPQHPSHSGVQGEAEKAAVELLSLELGGPSRPEKLKLREGESVHIDGYHGVRQSGRHLV
jgi:hypothetical protein